MKKVSIYLNLLFLFTLVLNVQITGQTEIKNLTKQVDFLASYEIASFEDLVYLTQNDYLWDKNIVLVNDIDARESKDMNDGKGLPTIGNNEVFFNGSFDGQAYSITNLCIHRTNEENVGLFGSISGAEIQNLNLENINITGRTNIGGLAGRSYYSVISNVIVEGSVLANCNNVGGLIGLNSESVINESMSNCDVTGLGKVGGMVGLNQDNSLLNNCHSFGTVTANADRAGGLVGYDKFSRIQNCYSNAIIYGNSFVGGLVGEAAYCRITNSYASGEVDGIMSIGGFIGEVTDAHLIACCYSNGAVHSYLYSSVGGFIGSATGTLHSNFWDVNRSGQMQSDGATAKNSAEMKMLETFTVADINELIVPWDFVGNPNDDDQDEDLWNISTDQNDGYPYLEGQLVLKVPEIKAQILSFYPNPASSVIHIALERKSNSIIRIYNFSGHLVKMINLDLGQSLIDVSDLETANYFIICENSGKRYYGKVAVQR